MSVIFINPYRFGGAPWTPAAITTELWLDAADASTLTTVDNAVSQWNDKSGRNRHATQSSPASRPTVILSSINNRNAIRFDGENDILNLPGISALAGISLFFVLRQNKQIAERNGGIVGLTKATTFGPHFGGGTGPERDWFDSFYSTNRVQVSSTAIPNGVYAGSIKHTGTQIVGIVLGLLSGSVNATFDGSPSVCTVGTAVGAGLVHSQNDYAELLLVQSPSVDIEQRVEGYLAHKWGLTANLPSDHPYKSAAPTI